MKAVDILKKLLGTAYSGLRAVIDYALPPRCPNCGAVILADHSFCVECWQSLHFLVEPACIQCGFPLPRDQQYELRCGRCLQHPPAFDRMNAAVAYDEISRTLILRCKYGRQTMLARDMAKLMMRFLPAKEDIQLSPPITTEKTDLSDAVDVVSKPPLIIPVPLHRWRLWQRGFNQAGLIGQYLAKASGYDYDCDSLYRSHSTKPLGHLTPKQRQETVRKSFAIRTRKNQENHLVGRDVILVDDVFTSGATTESCAKLLKKAGVRSVHVLCWARVIPKDSAL